MGSNPAFFTSIALCFAIYLYISISPTAAWVFILLVLPLLYYLQANKSLWMGYTIILISLALLPFRLSLPLELTNLGKATILIISHKQASQKPAAKAHLNTLTTKNGQLISNIPVFLSLPRYSRATLIPGATYTVNGRLRANQSGRYTFYPTSKLIQQQNIPLSLPISWREKAKTALQAHIANVYKDENISHFLSAMITGSLSDRLLKEQLKRFGLLHLLAVSGFHFSLAAIFVSSCLSFMLPYRSTLITTLLALSCYLMFLGPSPSVLRAFLQAFCLHLAPLLRRVYKPLNGLGLAATAILVYSPLMLYEIGFQLSFLITLSITTFYYPLHQWLYRIIPKREIFALETLSWWEKGAYLLLAFLRAQIALSISVALVALPFSLHTFHSFPLFGLVYNLFFPLCAALSLCLLWLALFLDLFYLGSMLHMINAYWTKALLHFATNLPWIETRTIDYCLSASLSYALILAILTFGLLYTKINRKLCLY